MPVSAPAGSRRGWRLWRTTVFRLTLAYAAFFALAGMALLVVILWSATGFMTRQVDASIAAEMAEVMADAADPALHGDPYKTVIDSLARRSPAFQYLLQSADGKPLAGNMHALRPVPGIRLMLRDHRLGHENNPEPTVLHGQGRVLPDGRFLFVGLNVYSVAEMRQSLARAFLWCLGPILALGLVSGFLLSMSMARKVERISVASRAIMDGDLSQRIARGGGGDEFDHLADSLNAMLDRIATLMLNLSQVTNDIAHDLRTPLTRLRQKLELAERDDLTRDALREALAGAGGELDRILSTFSALLRIAQIEAGSRRAGFTALDLRPLLQTLHEAYAPVTEEGGQTMTFQPGPLPLPVQGDPELLTQLVANLIENAITHAGPGAALALDAGRTGERVHITVSDTGPGIPAGLRQKVLQRFFRLESSRTTPGNGLGLSLVAAIAGLHDAELTLDDNHPGLRCTLTFAAAVRSTL
ncbi:sensor histidine kinase [Nguyenibacter vanlangensis]|uniref:histidine kinase n=1 Tax=Nguyenibacter vanlangensis TaxID=1216886 RepID=A0A7Y7IYZ9_9PROT|nr:HAMP domain-containing sensor histidine kinase [Nguyenibacter vanlangensis]NVN12598.1 HAMP domain-containing histidine kinase [Nguyenibacter vanlangensis]